MKPMFIYHVKGIVRYGDRLDSGLFEITLNKHYCREKAIENLKIAKKTLTYKGQKFIRYNYPGFDEH